MAGDFNGDGRTDLAVANHYSATTCRCCWASTGRSPPPALRNQPPRHPSGRRRQRRRHQRCPGRRRRREYPLSPGTPAKPGSFEPPVTVNPGNPSRDIAGVPDTDQGPVLASVDATDNAISLYGWRDGTFVRIGSLPTGSLPAQIVSADLLGDGGTTSSSATRATGP